MNCSPISLGYPAGAAPTAAAHSTEQTSQAVRAQADSLRLGRVRLRPRPVATDLRTMTLFIYLVNRLLNEVANRENETEGAALGS